MDAQTIAETNMDAQTIAETIAEHLEANRRVRAPIWDDDFKAAMLAFCDVIGNTKIITSTEAVIIPQNRQQDWQAVPVGKPQGLWYSCGGSWIEWCVNEDFGCSHLIHEIQLYSGKLCQISNEREFDEFSAEFGMKSSDFYRLSGHPLVGLVNLPELTGKFRPDYINWHDVANIWSGIEIDPYLWRRRLEGGMWYYGWDCASGCIWDVGAIHSIHLIATYNEQTKKVELIDDHHY